MAPNKTIETVKEKVNGVLSKYPVIDEPLQKVSENLKIDKAFIVIAIAIAVPIILYHLYTGGSLVIDLIGFLYPVYASIKAIESPADGDDTLWLTYWLVFSFFKIIEGPADFLLHYIPFYQPIKAAFLVWCYYPKTQGAKVIYASVVKPYLVPHLGLKAAAKKED